MWTIFYFLFFTIILDLKYFDCDEEQHFITEYIDNPKPNKFWCKKCYHFNQKMKQLK